MSALRKYISSHASLPFSFLPHHNKPLASLKTHCKDSKDKYQRQPWNPYRARTYSPSSVSLNGTKLISSVAYLLVCRQFALAARWGILFVYQKNAPTYSQLLPPNVSASYFAPFKYNYANSGINKPSGNIKKPGFCQCGCWEEKAVHRSTVGM
jgi:hypothetical protein